MNILLMRLFYIHFSLRPYLLISGHFSLNVSHWVEFTITRQTFILLNIDLHGLRRCHDYLSIRSESSFFFFFFLGQMN